jgi:hypothetical protein
VAGVVAAEPLVAPHPTAVKERKKDLAPAYAGCKVLRPPYRLWQPARSQGKQQAVELCLYTLLRSNEHHEVAIS